MEIYGLLWPFIEFAKKLDFSSPHMYIHKSLIWASKLHAPKIDETIFSLLQNSAWLLLDVKNSLIIVKLDQWNYEINGR